MYNIIKYSRCEGSNGIGRTREPSTEEGSCSVSVQGPDGSRCPDGARERWNKVKYNV